MARLGAEGSFFFRFFGSAASLDFLVAFFDRDDFGLA